MLKLVDRPQVSSSFLEALVQRDAAVTAKVLRVANSPFYGLTGCTSIPRSIHALGANQVRSLVIGVAYQQAIGSGSGSNLLDKHALWRHSMATAVAARILAKMKMPVRAEELYDAGMMHDVGLLVMDKFCPDELDESIRYATETGLPLHEAEQALYGYDHCEIGALLAKKWAIEDTMHGATYHYDLKRRNEHFEETCIIAAADAIAQQCGYDSVSSPDRPEMPSEAQRYLELPEEQLEVIRSVVHHEVQRAEYALAA